MIEWGTIILELGFAAIICLLFHRITWRKLSHVKQIVITVLCFCAAFISFSIGKSVKTPTHTLIITATGEKNASALENQVYLVSIKADGESQDIRNTASGKWTWYANRACWFDVGDDRLEEGTTERITFEIPASRIIEVTFLENRWKGIVEVELDEQKNTIDTFLDVKDGVDVNFQFSPSFSKIVLAVMLPTLGFSVAFLLICLIITGCVLTWNKAGAYLGNKMGSYSPMQKLIRHQFLFEELVQRDFKKKYKRTVLGMAWSVLSPLLQLLVMALVFTKFFGRTTSHYIIYLFCGNLVFNYFSDATKGGMATIMGNAGIFTKVNVPKYLFLLSRNVQALINFGLVLVVFFVFVAADGLPFTWKFICLIYPIGCLILFNIGVGMILSALFVFFRDIQYLYDVFTMLLMYMSAVFYTIDKYSYNVQCAFLINPVYLFIRYFRKIVIEATIPTIWFHLLMAADVVIVLGIGCFMYKKYNTKFLYYV